MDIDIVILWVDGADPAWQEQKRQFLSPRKCGSDDSCRYRDWGLLPYWFRAIEAYAPWVRRIHFVTWGHIPAFLNTSAPKLHIVNHTQFIPGAYLPTFSSHTIELNIHRIPGLAEHFLYFNDDTFLLRPMKETDFFRNGLPCTYGGEVPWTFSGHIGVWEHAAANDLGVINRHFPKRKAVRSHGRKYRDPSYRWKDNLRTLFLQKLYPDTFTGFKNLHAPAPYLKDTFRQVWDAEPELLHSTCMDKFRAYDNVNQWVCLWWQVASGCFSPCVVDNFVSCIEEDTIDILCRCIENREHAMVCLNDPEKDVDFGSLSLRLRQAFEVILPEKSIYEL